MISSSPTIGFAESKTPQWLVLSQPIKVLVVDDNEDNRILLVEYLRPLGFIVKEADNGQTGLAIAEDFNPDVILLDLLMPVMDGREMSDRIRQDPQLKDTLVVVISANTKSIIDSSDLKCDEILAKPLDFTKLLQLLARHLELDWQPLPPKSDSNSSLILPELDELNQLLELANSGNMDGLLEQINLLAAADSRYNDFAQKIRQLADSCQQAELEKLFKASMK
ncbi:MAG: response regulator [Cyanobacteria bacterium P01_E01_bin.35]